MSKVFKILISIKTLPPKISQISFALCTSMRVLCECRKMVLGETSCEKLSQKISHLQKILVSRILPPSFPSIQTTFPSSKVFGRLERKNNPEKFFFLSIQSYKGAKRFCSRWHSICLYIRSIIWFRKLATKNANFVL